MDQKGTTITTSCKTLELFLVFSILDAISDQKGTTIMTSHNDCNKKVRQRDKISSKNPGEAEKNNLKNQSDKSFELLHQIQGKRAKRSSFNEKFTTKKTSCKNHKRYIIKTGKTSHVDHHKLNSILMIKDVKIFVTVKAVQPRKPIVMVVKDQKITKIVQKTQYLKNCSSFVSGKVGHQQQDYDNRKRIKRNSKQQLMPVGAWR